MAKKIELKIKFYTQIGFAGNASLNKRGFEYARQWLQKSSCNHVMIGDKKITDPAELVIGVEVKRRERRFKVTLVSTGGDCYEGTPHASGPGKAVEKIMDEHKLFDVNLHTMLVITVPDGVMI